MALLTSTDQLAGQHLSVYEEYWNAVDYTRSNALNAQDAAAFLKKSGVSEIILSKIWELSDCGAKGYLDKLDFFRALKLIALVQNGHEATIGNLAMSTGPPSLGAVSKKDDGAGVNWAISALERMKYNKLFENLQPNDGKLSGDKVRSTLINSGLSVEVLSKIWELSDHDKDGQLDIEEFAVAMYLVYQSLEKKPLPPSLPADLIPPNHRPKRKPPVGGVAVLPGGSIPSFPLQSTQTSGAVAQADPFGSSAWPSAHTPTPPAVPSHDEQQADHGAGWVVSPQLRATSEARFAQLDTDGDGLVNGSEVRDVFLQSGLPQATLAAIWSLCDIYSTGSLTKDQFSLAMFFIEEKRMKGLDPPAQLAPDMIPPSMRITDAPLNTGLSKELLQIESEIEDIKRRKIQLEADKQQREADVRIRVGEVQTLQKEYEAINSTIQQLEKQRGEATKKLDELEDHKTRLNNSVAEVRDKCAAKQREIDEIKEQLLQHDRNEKQQEEELNRLKSEFLALTEEERSLEQKIYSGKERLKNLKQSEISTAAEVDKIKRQVAELKANNETIQQAITQYKALVNGEDGAVEPDQSVFRDSPAFRQSDMRLPPVTNQHARANSPFSNQNLSSDVSFDPFGFGSSKGFGDEPFAKTDPFGAKMPVKAIDNIGTLDPFASEDPFKQVDPFASDDPFKSESLFASSEDPFANSEPFKEVRSLQSNGSLKGSSQSTAFSADFSSSSVGKAAKSAADAFGSRPKSTDPFSSLDMFESSLPARPASAAAIKSSDPFDPFGDFGTSSSKNAATTDGFGFDAFADTNKKTSPSVQKKSAPARPAMPRPKVPTPTETPFIPFPSKTSESKNARTQRPLPSEDAFGGFDSDPFASKDPFSNLGQKSKDPFSANFADFGSGFGDDDDEQALDWAKVDSNRLEAERQRKLKEQEDADFAFALALSKADA